MTSCARGRERCCQVIWVGHAGVVGLVARVTIGRCAGILSTDVAIRALDTYMRTSERECRPAVIKVRWRPCGRTVTDFAGLGEARGNVVRIRRVVEVRQMARIAESA